MVIGQWWGMGCVRSVHSAVKIRKGHQAALPSLENKDGEVGELGTLLRAAQSGNTHCIVHASGVELTATMHGYVTNMDCLPQLALNACRLQGDARAYHLPSTPDLLCLKPSPPLDTSP